MTCTLKSAIIALICLSTIFSCRKKDPIIEPTPVVNDTEMVTASVRGTVVNENNIPIQNATVTIGGLTTTTNIYGIFEFINKPVSKNNTHIKVVYSGYFNGNRSLMSTANGTSQVRIKLLPKTITGTITASAGGTVSLATGATVNFPANAIVDASGSTYSGVVNVAMAYINPTATDLSSIIQGDLRGINTAGSENALETFGMIGVELETTGGQPLKIASGKKATLTNPIPATILSNAPNTIPLWHFDEVKGRWLEEGTATKVGNNYVGDVSHFSFWNLDVGFPLAQLCVTVTNGANQPLNNVAVVIKRTGVNASSGGGTTNNLGVVCGAVPKNETLVLQILDLCGNVVYSQNIGPYSSNASVNIVTSIPPSNHINISGTIVDCSNNPVSNGLAFIITSNGHHYQVPTNSSGNFLLTILNCAGTSINYSIFGIDNTNNQQGLASSGIASTGTLNLGNIAACGSNSAEYVNLLIDGVPYNWSKPTNRIVGGAFNSAAITLPPYTVASQYSAYEAVSGVLAVGNAWVFTFKHNYTPGVYPLVNIIPQAYCQIQIRSLANVYVMYSDVINSPNPTVNLTEVGPSVTGFYAGNFNITMPFQPGNITRNVSCNFRVRRP
jgi:hypothetical protein